MPNPPKLCGDCGVQMEANADVYALPGLDQSPTGWVFTTNRAMPVTAYMCPNCGRFKFISAMFLGNMTSAEGDAQESGGNINA